MTGSDARIAAERVDRLLAQLSAADPRAAAAAEELTRCLVQLYGAALARIVDIVGAGQSTELCADPLVESLLLVHDLHPLDADTRIRHALRTCPDEPEYRGIDAAGVAHLRLTGGGCGSARRAAVDRVRAVVQQAAPEVAGVEVDTPPAAPPLLQVSRRPDTAVRSAPPVVAGPAAPEQRQPGAAGGRDHERHSGRAAGAAVADAVPEGATP